ncbi:lipopolysaccharide biosynthesis protein [Pseudozobellia thermophila]|uniref:Na+-driven multidrug efflux pump n=1 Tax=Pseudozobellia thermophila TaxID=192903 RepID=A0A1M6KNZ7_9FLAO|nr:oligosaccharide flippase family protein [Pseudozobellia thermophila]SHJ60655.1 Na+-driven multidrug efflux pump [Pseudozobellia thermophila]
MTGFVSKVFSKILRFINRGHQRSVKAKKNIIASFLIKGISILIGFYMVPLTIGYVQKEQYGIWLTISSVVAWFAFLDIGLGHGLRNKLSEAIAKGEWKKAKIYVSTTYVILGIIFLLIFALFFVVEPWLNWQTILNTQSVEQGELRLVAITTFLFFCVNFVLRLIDSIFYAFQRPAFKGFINLMSNVLTLSIIIILTHTTEGNLLYLALTLGISPMVVLFAVSLFMFNSEFKSIAPSIKYVKRSYFNDLISLGVRFFLVNISVVIIFATDNMIITQLFGPSEVPAYSIAHKYFGLITVGFSFILVPMWSAYTEAYVKNDIDWVLSVVNKLKKAWMVLVVIAIILLAISKPFFKLWVPEIDVPWLLSVMMCIYVIVLSWGNIFVNFVNGVGKIRLQMIVGIIGTIVNIPLSYFFGEILGLGSAGVIGASIVSIAYGPVLAPIQFKKIIKGTASGIWNS